jgi:hypothetical protein
MTETYANYTRHIHIMNIGRLPPETPTVRTIEDGIVYGDKTDAKASSFGNLMAYAKYSSPLVDLYLLGFDKKDGMAAICYYHKEKCLGFLTIFHKHRHLEQWCEDYGYCLSFDPTFKPQLLSSAIANAGTHLT